MCRRGSILRPTPLAVRRRKAHAQRFEHQQARGLRTARPNMGVADVCAVFSSPLWMASMIARV